MNNGDVLLQILQFIMPLAFIGLGVLFVVTQTQVLKAMRPESQQIHPGQLWLQLIPFWGAYWQFVVIKKLSWSIARELNTPIEESIFAETNTGVLNKPTYNIGYTYATLFCVAVVIPNETIQGAVALTGVVCWVIYWVQLVRYGKQIKQRLSLA